MTDEEILDYINANTGLHGTLEESGKDWLVINFVKGKGSWIIDKRKTNRRGNYTSDFASADEHKLYLDKRIKLIRKYVMFEEKANDKV